MAQRGEAKNRGWVAFDGSLRMQEFRDNFVSHYGHALRSFDDDILGDLNGVNGGMLASLFRQLPSRRHPLKHVLLLNFLFADFARFSEVVHEVRQLLDLEGHDGCEKRMRDSQATLLKMVQEHGISISSAAPVVGTTVSSAAKFLNKLGDVNHDRRPHVVGTDKEVLLQELLKQGLSRTELARRVGVRRTFIKDYLAQRPELKEAWKSAHRENEKQAHRMQLMSTLENYPGLPIKAVRRIPKNGFQWLYVNDREWLQEILPAIWKR